MKASCQCRRRSTRCQRQAPRTTHPSRYTGTGIRIREDLDDDDNDDMPGQNKWQDTAETRAEFCPWTWGPWSEMGRFHLLAWGSMGGSFKRFPQTDVQSAVLCRTGGRAARQSDIAARAELARSLCIEARVGSMVLPTYLCRRTNHSALRPDMLDLALDVAWLAWPAWVPTATSTASLGTDGTCSRYRAMPHSQPGVVSASLTGEA